MKHIKSISEDFGSERKMFNQEYFQNISDEVQATLQVLVDQLMMHGEETAEGAQWFAVDIEDLHSTQDTLGEDSIMVTDQNGDNQEIKYANISAVSIDGGEEITSEDL